MRRARKEVPKVVEEARETLGLKRVIDLEAQIPEVGSIVRVSSFSISGEVVDVDPGTASVTVASGGKTLKVGAGDVTVIEEPKTEGSTVEVGVSLDDVSTQLNIIGKTVAEAEMELDPFLDRAAMAGVNEVWVIHGIGTGRLRNGVISYLKSSPHVSSFEEAAPWDGGAGATVVKLG